MNWLLFFKNHHSELLIYIFIISAIIGSFLNVVIYRYPIMLQREWQNECLTELKQTSTTHDTEKFNLCTPRSHCPHCKKKIAFWMNIPILSYIFLRGKCHHCHARISSQYFFVELISAVLPTLIILHFGYTFQSMMLIIFSWGLITLSFIDFNHLFLPDSITYFLLWLGLALSIRHTFTSSAISIEGVIVGYLFLWIIAKLFLILRHKEGMGLGDCKMLAMIGAWVGLFSLLNVLLFSTLLALIISLLLLMFRKIERSRAIPFGPYLATAGWITMMYGNQILYWTVRWHL